MASLYTLLEALEGLKARLDKIAENLSVISSETYKPKSGETPLPSGLLDQLAILSEKCHECVATIEGQLDIVLGKKTNVIEISMTGQVAETPEKKSIWGVFK